MQTASTTTRVRLEARTRLTALRLYPSEFNWFSATANAAGLKLSGWMRLALRDAAERKFLGTSSS